MPLKLEPVSEKFVALVRGVDLREPLSVLATVTAQVGHQFVHQLRDRDVADG